MKEDFIFEYSLPSGDWHETIKKVIKFDDFDYFYLELRYNNAWWAFGVKEKRKEELGRLSAFYLDKFIKWCEIYKAYGQKGSKIKAISMLTIDFNIFNEIKKIISEGE